MAGSNIKKKVFSWSNVYINWLTVWKLQKERKKESENDWLNKCYRFVSSKGVMNPRCEGNCRVCPVTKR